MVVRTRFRHLAVVSVLPRIDVFQYLDHRAYLRAVYEHGRRRGLGYRAFSKRAGLGSPNYLKLVIDGDRNLTPTMAQRFARACGLEGDQALYFQDLVAFAQAKTSPERSACYVRLLRFRQFRKEHRLERSQDAFHSKWYLPAIREMVGCADFCEDPGWIATRLVPAIRPQDAERALKTLLELGLLVRDDRGRLVRSQAIILAPPQTRSTHLARFHRTMMQHAAESIDRVHRDQRDLTAITLRVPSTAVAELKRRLSDLRRELLAWSEEQADADQVVQVNFQLFPLTLVLDANEKT